MKSKQKDYFSEKAAGFDAESSITQNVESIGSHILQQISFTKDMHIMDFGSGTGLLLCQIAPFVGKITAVDISASMNDVLQTKLAAIDCTVELLEMDLTKETLDTKFDGIISSMTIHHIEYVQELFIKFYSLLKDKGIIAIADLDEEDGSFHTEDTGVFHNGFDRNELLNFAKNAGFKNLKIQTASTVIKPKGNYPVFLLTGEK